MAKSTTKKKRAGNRCKVGYFNGKLMGRWDAAFEFRQKILKTRKYISCTQAMKDLADDAGNRQFADSTAEKQQWKLQRMFTQLEADNFKEPTKGEHYVMLYEILYSTKQVAMKVGESVEVVEVDLEPNEKVMIIREMIKMGGHYAAEKSEGKLTGKLIVEFGKGNLQPFVPDSKNRMVKYN